MAYKIFSKSINNAFNSEILRILAFPFILFIGFIYFLPLLPRTSYLLEIIGALLFFPVSIEAFESYENKSSFKMPKAGALIGKSLNVFAASLLSSLVILLGLIFFIIPGIGFAIRYTYAGIVAEREMVGPLEAMKRSNLYSKHNGGQVWLSTLALTILFPLILVNVVNGYFYLISISAIDEGLYPLLAIVITIFSLCAGWLFVIIKNSLFFYGYKNALNASNMGSNSNEDLREYLRE